MSDHNPPSAVASAERPSPAALPAFLPHAARQLQAPFSVRLLVELQDEYVSKGDDSKGKKVAKGKSTAQTTHEGSQEPLTDESPAEAAESGLGEVTVAVALDSAGRVAEVALLRSREIPRLLLQIVALCAPYQPALERLSVRHGRLGGAALHELAKLPALSNLTDVCLDDSPVRERNYGELLATDRLRRLSLARCALGDDGCGELAARLAYPLPASRSLAVLTLTSNAITDVGAAALADALRGNRALLYLDLAGNRISDAGAAAVFGVLREFPLRYEELVAARGRRFDYLKLRRAIYERLYAEALGESVRARRRPTALRRPTAPCEPRAAEAAARAEAMVAEALGPFADPFGPEETVMVDGFVHSAGNGALTALNLAHNDLSYAAVRALLRTLRWQAARASLRDPTGLSRLSLRDGGAAGGLLRVTLDGNALPVACPEYRLVAELLELALMKRLVRQSKSKSEKSSRKSGK